MKGFLSFLMLRMISQQDMSGDCIRKELEKRRGCLPSPGTIYPVLKELKAEGFIQEIKGDGKMKKYKITPEGKKELKLAMNKFIALFYDLKDEFSKCC